MLSPTKCIRILMHPLILQNQITPKTSRYTRCSMSTLPNVSINGRIRSSGPIGEMVVQHQPLPVLEEFLKRLDVSIGWM